MENKVKLRNMYFVLRIFKDIFEKNKEKGVLNNYSKDQIKAMIMSSYGILDPRSIDRKFDFGRMLGIIQTMSISGYRINPEVVTIYNDFIKKHRKELIKLDLLSEY